jgi:8-oxo-dGTP pyrophosphatase MutT (NUDIX family)
MSVDLSTERSTSTIPTSTSTVPTTISAVSTPTFNISRKDFAAAYNKSIIISCNRGGTAIFTSNMEALLLVKSKVSGKWGLPKGIRDHVTDKNDLITALRETSEETGINVSLATPLLPSIVVEDAKIYGLILPKTTLFQPEAKEISEIMWFTIDHLIDRMKTKCNEFTRMLRVFVLRKKMSRLQHKMYGYKENYTMVKGVLNSDIHKMLSTIDSTRKNMIQKAYDKYVCIHKKYPGVFSQNDVITCIRSL